jgi:hypothetical protein
MPSSEHEVLIDLFRERPELAADLLRSALHITVPDYAEATTESGNITELAPAEYRADSVIVLRAPDPVLAIVLEIQRSRDRWKRRSWPMYVAGVWTRLECPVVLLVVATRRALARWCATPIRVGEPGFVLTPQVLGPDVIPVVTDPGEVTRAPELAALSAVAHGGRPGGRKVLEAFVEGIYPLGGKAGTEYTDYVLMALPAAARREMEIIMQTGTHRYRNDLLRKYYDLGEADGEARGEARAVLAVLSARGMPVSGEARDRIAACMDLAQLEVWIRRAATIDTVEALFE